MARRKRILVVDHTAVVGGGEIARLNARLAGTKVEAKYTWNQVVRQWLRFAVACRHLDARLENLLTIISTPNPLSFKLRIICI
jgi:hypothetical protein